LVRHLRIKVGSTRRCALLHDIGMTVGIQIVVVVVAHMILDSLIIGVSIHGE
jgi:hypothetical protein